jgi:hypothetical protein
MVQPYTWGTTGPGHQPRIDHSAVFGLLTSVALSVEFSNSSSTVLCPLGGLNILVVRVATVVMS